MPGIAPLGECNWASLNEGLCHVTCARRPPQIDSTEPRQLMSGITATGRAPRKVELPWPLGCSLDGTTQEPKPCVASLRASVRLCVGTTVYLALFQADLLCPSSDFSLTRQIPYPLLEYALNSSVPLVELPIAEQSPL